MELIKAKEKFNVMELNSILPEGLVRANENLEGFEVKEKAKQTRLYHLVVHTLAFIIVVPYIIMLTFGSEINPSYSTTVSIVIGFYFAKSLFN